jgi:hypothetical protein
MRYIGATGDSEEDKTLRKGADELMNFLNNLDLPEIDIDRYDLKHGKSIVEYARQIC